MNPLHRPRLWARIVGGLLVLTAAWLTLVPVTVVYVTSDANPVPRKITTVYSWSTAEQDLVYSDATGSDPAHLDTYLQRDHLTNSIRLNCGSVLAVGPHVEQQKPDGLSMCAGVRGPRRIASLTLFVLALVALLVSLRLPAEPEKYRNRYRQPYSQRRLLRRGR